MHVAFGVRHSHNFIVALVEYQTTNIGVCSLIYEVIPNHLKFVRFMIPLGLCCIQEFTIQHLSYAMFSKED